MLYTKKIEKVYTYDAVVCGGGFAGFAAAYAAAREGLKVVLVERNTCLGGVGTQGLVNQILGVRLVNKQDYTYTTCVGDVFTQLEKRILAAGGGVDVDSYDRSFHPHGWKPSLSVGLVFDGEQMKYLLEQMLREVGVTVLYGTEVVDVIREGEKLTGIVIHNKSGFAVIEGACFVDATGDADICAFAGCPFMKGDEEGEMAAASLEMHVENVDYEKLTAYMKETDDTRCKALIGPLKESGEWKFPYEIFISVMLTRKDVFMINTIRQVGIDGTDGESLSNAVIDGRRENFELFAVMKKHFPGFENASIRQIAPVVGVRETRRIEGQYTLSVADLMTGKDFEDGIALSSYIWDMPNPKNPSYQPFKGVKRASLYTQIPYRCLLPKGADNLIAVGRCVSVEREALGPVRVMGPCIAMGVAAGIATKHAVAQQNDYGAVDVQKLRADIVSNGGYVDRAQAK